MTIFITNELLVPNVEWHNWLTRLITNSWFNLQFKIYDAFYSTFFVLLIVKLLLAFIRVNFFRAMLPLASKIDNLFSSIKIWKMPGNEPGAAGLGAIHNVMSPYPITTLRLFVNSKMDKL